MIAVKEETPFVPRTSGTPGRDDLRELASHASPDAAHILQEAAIAVVNPDQRRGDVISARVTGQTLYRYYRGWFRNDGSPEAADAARAREAAEIAGKEGDAEHIWERAVEYARHYAVDGYEGTVPQ